MKQIKPSLLLVFFYLLFTFTFKNISTIHTLVIYGVCILYILYNYKYLKKYLSIVFYGKLKYSVIALIICCIATVVIPNIHNTQDYAYLETLTSIVRSLLKLIALLILFEKKHKEEANIKLFSKYIILSTCMYIFSTIIFVAFPALKEVWNNIIYDPDYHIILENDNYITRYGLMGFSGFQLAFKVAFAIAINSYIIIKDNMVIKKTNVSMYITYGILLLGSLFYGRIGMVVGLVITAILMLLAVIKSKKRIIYCTIGIITLIILCVILYNNKAIKYWMDWALAPFVNFVKTGKIYTVSSNHLFKYMIFMPPTKTFLIGDGYYDNYYMLTDSGFMRPMLFYGIFFTIIGYLSILIPIIDMIIKSIKNKEKALGIMFLDFLIMLIIIEIKGEIFYRLLPLVVTYILLYEREREIKNINNEENKLQEKIKDQESTKKISIIMPVYNSEKYLSKAINSVLEQTYKNIELILIDDGSTDNSLNILKEYENKDSRIKVFRQENAGQFKARNMGIKVSEGEYITFLDSDDWLEPNMIETMIKLQLVYNADIVRCTYIDEHVEENRQVYNRSMFNTITCIEKQEFTEKLYPIFLNTQQLNSVWGQLIKKDIIKEFNINEDIKIAEDLLFNLNLYSDTNKIILMPNAYYHYRTNSESITNTKNKKSVLYRFNNKITVYSEFYKYIQIWDINTDDNIDRVNKKILNEVNKCINELYTFKISKKERIAILKIMYEKLKTRIPNIFNSKKVNIECKLFLEQKYNILNSIKLLKFKTWYDIKKVIKKILIFTNSRFKK